jgi:hypothetical protein
MPKYDECSIYEEACRNGTCEHKKSGKYAEVFVQEPTNNLEEYDKAAKAAYEAYWTVMYSDVASLKLSAYDVQSESHHEMWRKIAKAAIDSHTADEERSRLFGTKKLSDVERNMLFKEFGMRPDVTVAYSQSLDEPCKLGCRRPCRHMDWSPEERAEYDQMWDR